MHVLIKKIFCSTCRIAIIESNMVQLTNVPSSSDAPFRFPI